jgi:hypothetical protein
LISGKGKDISLLHSTYAGFGALSVSDPMSTKVLLPDVKQPEHEANANLVPTLIIIIFTD